MIEDEEDFRISIAGAQEKAINQAINRYDYEQAIHLINKEKYSAELELIKAKCYKNLLQFDKATKSPAPEAIQPMKII